VVEDNAVNQRVAVKMLERLGYRADVAANGIEAVEALSRIPYAAVLMDVQMPEMDGLEATAEIRRREGAERRTPIIAMTASAMHDDRDRALEAGMDDFVSKPVKPEDLSTVLERWVIGAEDAEAGGAEPGGVSDGNAPDGPAIDRSVLAGLEELRDTQEEGEPDALHELIELFLADVSSQMGALREAVGAGDALSMERIAHSLKGSCANMGAVGMQGMCAELEEMGRSGELAGAPGLIDRLEEEFGRVSAVFEEELSKS
jgi:CheY-like chemotaxis protein